MMLIRTFRLITRESKESHKSHPLRCKRLLL